MLPLQSQTKGDSTKSFRRDAQRDRNRKIYDPANAGEQI